MKKKKKALGSSRSFFAGGSACFGTVALSFKLSWSGGELLAAAVAETSLRSTSWHFFCFFCYRIGR